MSIEQLRHWSKKWLTSNISSSAMLDVLEEYDALSDKLAALTDERNKLLARVVELENSLKHKEGIIESIWAGDSGTECAECCRLTANGICTECRHGTSPTEAGSKRAIDAEAARDADREVYLEASKAREQQVAAALTAEAQAVKRADELKKKLEAAEAELDEYHCELGYAANENADLHEQIFRLTHCAAVHEDDFESPCALDKEHDGVHKDENGATWPREPKP